MRSTTKRTICWLALLLALMSAGPAFADETLPKPEVEAALVHFDAGNAAFRSAQARTDPALQRAEYENAIKEYLAGVQAETKFHYTFYWNLGHAYRQLGEYTRADHFYKKFIEFAPARYTLHRTAAEDFRRMMQAELEKQASLAEPNAPAPAPLHEPRPLPGAPATGPTGARAWYSDKLGWGLTGGGAVALGVGLALRQSGASLHDRANEAQLPQSERQDLRDRASTRLTAGTIVASAGAALALAGVIKLSLNDGKRSAGNEVQVSLSPGGVAVAGRF